MCQQLLNSARVVMCYNVQCLHTEFLRPHCARGDSGYLWCEVRLAKDELAAG